MASSYGIFYEELEASALSLEALLERISKPDLGVTSALIVSSAPVEAVIYKALLSGFKNAGIKSESFHLVSIDSSQIENMAEIIRDISEILRVSSLLVVSYHKSLAPAVIASYFIASGHDIDTSIDNTKRICANSAEGLGKYSFFFKNLEKLYKRGIKPIHEPSLQAAVKSESSPAKPAKVHPEPIIRPLPVPASKKTSIPANDDHIKSVKKTPPAEVRASVSEKKPRKTPDKSEKKNPDIIPSSIPDEIKVSHIGPFYRSLRFKLIFIISFIIIASMSGMILLASYFFKKDNEIRVQESNHKISEVIAMKIKSEMDKYQIIAESILEYRMGNSDPRGIEKEILFAGISNGEKSAKKLFSRTYYNDELMNRFMLAPNDLETIHEQIKKQIERTLRGETVVINISPFLEQTVIAILYPISMKSKNIANSIIVLYLFPDEMLKTFQATGITKVFMVNDSGDILAHPEKSAILSAMSISSLPIFNMMKLSKVDNGYKRFQDEKGRYLLGSFKRTGFGGCGIIATVEEEKAFQEVYNILRRNFYLMGIVLTSAILFVFFFGNTITNPIIKLVGATKKIMSGQYSVNIKPTSKDEIGHLTSTFVEMGKGLEERERMKEAFGKFVNKEIAEKVLKGEIKLGGERKIATIFFSDIRSFTAISEKLEPEEVVEFLNQYMTRMVQCVNLTNGVVDKFIGDAIMAVWGVPVSYGNDCKNAINGALLMRYELMLFNRVRGTEKKPIIRIGCGINTGPILAGQIGSEERMEYTVIGDAVNLASRIESLNKPFGTDILISDDTYSLVKDIYRVEPMKKIKVKGKSEPQQIYAVLGPFNDPETPQSLEELRKMIGSKVSGKPDAGDEEEVKYEIIE
jgi:adenylate cyclase